MPDDGAGQVGQPLPPTIDRGTAEIALAGLRARQKSLPARLFYDEAGCQLFEAITNLAEYYPTRTEMALLAKIAPEIQALTPQGTVLVEYGASDENKASLLLRAGNFSAYVPIDVAASALARLAHRMHHRSQPIVVIPIVADFLEPISLPTEIAGLPRLGFFPGSTIGNLDPGEIQKFLLQAKMTLGTGAQFVIGADLRKDPAILLPAYDDGAGVTAAFNLNLLVRLNREAAADFNLENFRHEARWNDAESRIEMHLISLCNHRVNVADETIRFLAGESIHTENSYKFTESDLACLAAAAGWRLAKSWVDPARLFSVLLFDQTSNADP